MNFEVNEGLTQEERKEKALSSFLASLGPEQADTWTYSEA
jgi:hypothetical protein